MKASAPLTMLLCGAALAACGAPSSPYVEIGDRAPTFGLSASDGRTVTLADSLAQGPALLYFNMAFG